MDVDAVAVRASLDDPERFGEVFDRNYRVIWAYLARLAGREAAEDVACDVFLAAFRTRDRFDSSRGSVRSWLYGIASNLLRRRFRSDERARRAFSRVFDDRLAVEETTVVDDADELRIELVQVRRAISELRAVDREIIVLAVWEELTYAEIASALEIPVGTVRSRLSRARARLRELMLVLGEVSDRSSSRS